MGFQKQFANSALDIKGKICVVNLGFVAVIAPILEGRFLEFRLAAPPASLVSARVLAMISQHPVLALFRQRLEEVVWQFKLRSNLDVHVDGILLSHQL